MPALTLVSESRAENVHEVKVLAMKISKDLQAQNPLKITDITHEFIGVQNEYRTRCSKLKAVNFWPGPTCIATQMSASELECFVLF